MVPALIFLVLVRDPVAARGWGIPMATDIAFALGVLALLGSRAPFGLRVFITALAIVDDLLAVLVIAVFYTADLSLPALAAAGGLFLAARRLQPDRDPAGRSCTRCSGSRLWLAVFLSGVHATVAGVLLALTIPSTTRLDSDAFVATARAHVDEFEDRTTGGEDARTERHHAALWELEAATERAQAPMLRFEHVLQPWVAFVIVPVFALANAGVRIGDDLLATLVEPIALGVIVGLVVGKQVGITLDVGGRCPARPRDLADRGGLAPHLRGGWLGGIGFTMSLFIASPGLSARAVPSSTRPRSGS